MRLVDGGRAKGFGMVQHQQLIEAVRESIEGAAWTGDCGAPQGAGVGVVEVVSVGEIVEREVAVPDGVPIHAPGAFSISDPLFFSPRGEMVGSEVRQGNVWEQTNRGQGKSRLGDQGVRENTLAAGRAPRLVKRFARGLPDIPGGWKGFGREKPR